MERFCRIASVQALSAVVLFFAGMNYHKFVKPQPGSADIIIYPGQFFPSENIKRASGRQHTADNFQATGTFIKENAGDFDHPVSADPAPSVGAEFRLDQNSPNPFNPTTDISFVTPVVASVTLTVYDILGHRVAVLLEEQPFDSGRHTVVFDGSTLTSGIYIYRLQAEDTVLTHKMILSKSSIQLF